jgi:hypothetical protein
MTVKCGNRPEQVPEHSEEDADIQIGRLCRQTFFQGHFRIGTSHYCDCFGKRGNVNPLTEIIDTAIIRRLTSPLSPIVSFLQHEIDAHDGRHHKNSDGVFHRDIVVDGNHVVVCGREKFSAEARPFLGHSSELFVASAK